MSCFFVMIAMDEAGNKCRVPRFEPKGDVELRRWKDAELRKADHLKWRDR